MNARLDGRTLARFWAKVEKTDGCWLWRGGKKGAGYGEFYSDGRIHGAHRVAYEIAKGPVPEGLLVMHTCDVMACVNPAHLVVGTRRDNTQDMIRKGRDRGPNTHCRRGHPLRPDTVWQSLRRDGSMGRTCKVCRRLRRQKKHG